ncbi:MAG TPA: VOC family protein [Methylomirabilota bacterium]|jgi:catechol-2,3-dioxygenase|nr:VOC family protein [Methylomirabilota bacterium]
MTTPTVAFSHFGIHVTDLARMEDFYTRVLGLLVSDRGTLSNGGPTLVFLSHDPDEHHQIVLVTGRPPGVEYNVVNQISFKLPTLADLQAMHARMRAEGVKEFRVVTHGNAWSVYFADPEGNRVELFVDTPWHTPQPFAEPFDIEAPVERIMAETEAICRRRPDFASRAEWRQAQVERMGVA